MTEKKDMLQTVNIPRYIKICSMLYIAAIIFNVILNLPLAIINEGHISRNQFSIVIHALSNITLGLVFWGTGQVFSKFMEKNT